MNKARAIVLLLSAFSLGCGATSAGGDSCWISASVMPASPLVGNVLTGEAVSSGPNGIRSFSWTVTDPNATTITTTQLASDGSRVEFVANTAGTYSITVDGSIGLTTCASTNAQVTVTPDGATIARYRLRYIPLTSQPAPPQEDSNLFDVFGGQVTLPLSDHTLDGGELVAGTIAGPSGALSAQLRLRNRSGGRRFDLLADQGNYMARLPSSMFDVQVIPYDPTVAAREFAAQSTTDLQGGYTLAAGSSLTGSVRGPGGGTVSAARVAMGTSGLPAIVVSTAGDGTFTTPFPTSPDPQTLTVVAPVNADWPALELDSGSLLAASDGSSLVIEWAPVSSVGLVGTVTADDTVTSLPGAEVFFIARPGVSGGTVRVDGGVPVVLVGSVRKRVVADSAGALPAFVLPRALYDVVVVPPPGASDQRLGFSPLDLSTASPGSIAVSSRAAMLTNLSVVDAGSTPVVGAKIVAVARGLLGVGRGRTVQATTDGAGSAVLPLANTMVYDLRIEAPLGVGLTRKRVTLTADPGPQTITLPRAIIVEGNVIFSSSTGQPGVRVEAYCDGCPTSQETSLPIAETVTEIGGAFRLYIPDPDENLL